uniref:ATP synthase complex subunit 8 n=1 Tax=Cynoglossus zanzibarensis TaxID=526613 RepID=A0A3G0Z5M6_9PLEU|nr:ATP synthase F0 subunit 8 [Cynoglossus zanzibarensis]AID59750.1 ATP synthase F0 subunit 8 [Cynoglossus zanzibarensis]
MPQLNPSPWMLIWLSSWIIFLLTIPPLVLMFKPSNAPTTDRLLNPLNPWSWPWP